MDQTFGTAGTDGVATVGIDGRANDVVVQDDGSIVVAGIASRDGEGGEFGDLFVARLLASGGLDLSFGLSAPVVTDVGGLTNEAQM